jgi:uncharacterized protein (DUF1684 family)
VILDTAAMDIRRDRGAVSQSARDFDPSQGEGYVASITADRQAKDAYFRTAADSPLRRPDAELRALSYFRVDERYRIVVARLRRPPPSDRPLALDTSDGERRIARRVAFLDFDLHGQRLTLTGFSIGSTPPGSLFVPFVDATSGNETYGSGRYLDLEIEPDGSVVVDFNLAYHPYCAYSSVYSCPLTPAENRVAVPILAGERLPP